MTWEGRLRPPLKDQHVYPPIESGALKTWIGVGGSPESVVRAAHYDFPLALAIIGGDPEAVSALCRPLPSRLRPIGQAGKKIAVHSPGYVAENDAQAREEYVRGYKAMHDRIGGERGWPPITRAQFEQEVEHGSLYVGAPETVARKIAATAKALGIVRFDLKYSAGTLPHGKMMRSIELYGSKVMPLVRETLSVAEAAE